MKKVVPVVIAMTLLTLSVILTKKAFFTKKTPLQLAERQSGLSLPNALQLIVYDNPPFINGDLFRVIEFSFTEKQQEHNTTVVTDLRAFQ